MSVRFSLHRKASDLVRSVDQVLIVAHHERADETPERVANCKCTEGTPNNSNLGETEAQVSQAEALRSRSGIPGAHRHEARMRPADNDETGVGRCRWRYPHRGHDSAVARPSARTRSEWAAGVDAVARPQPRLRNPRAALRSRYQSFSGLIFSRIGARNGRGGLVRLGRTVLLASSRLWRPGRRGERRARATSPPSIEPRCCGAVGGLAACSVARGKAPMPTLRALERAGAALTSAAAACAEHALGSLQPGIQKYHVELRSPRRCPPVSSEARRLTTLVTRARGRSCRIERERPRAHTHMNDELITVRPPSGTSCRESLSGRSQASSAVTANAARPSSRHAPPRPAPGSVQQLLEDARAAAVRVRADSLAELARPATLPSTRQSSARPSSARSSASGNAPSSRRSSVTGALRAPEPKSRAAIALPGMTSSRDPSRGVSWGSDVVAPLAPPSGAPKASSSLRFLAPPSQRHPSGSARTSSHGEMPQVVFENTPLLQQGPPTANRAAPSASIVEGGDPECEDAAMGGREREGDEEIARGCDEPADADRSSLDAGEGETALGSNKPIVTDPPTSPRVGLSDDGESINRDPKSDDYDGDSGASPLAAPDDDDEDGGFPASTPGRPEDPADSDTGLAVPSAGATTLPLHPSPADAVEWGGGEGQHSQRSLNAGFLSRSSILSEESSSGDSRGRLTRTPAAPPGTPPSSLLSGASDASRPGSQAEEPREEPGSSGVVPEWSPLRELRSTAGANTMALRPSATKGGRMSSTAARRSRDVNTMHDPTSLFETLTGVAPAAGSGPRGRD